MQPKVPKLVVKTAQGKLLGTERTSDLNGIGYYAFLGIPYAKPPIGNLRFMPPEPFDSWKGIRNATAMGNDCLHRIGTERDQETGSEDCLYLNVFTPQPPQEIQNLKPVIILIHCGGHGWGSGSPDYFGGPDFVIHHDIIWVSFNYRLHAFGFLNLELPGCAGNMAMKDQVMALKWVKANIQSFGGDPDNITLYGASSGASDVHLHRMSPLSKGLFHKVICQGGYSLSTLWGYQTDHIERAFDLAEQLEFKERNNRRKLLRFLKTVTASEIAEAVEKLTYKLKKTVRTRPYHGVFHPTIEIFKEGAFLSRSPRDLMYSVDTEPIPLLCGIAQLEGILAFTGKPYKENLSDIIKDNLWMYKINSSTLQMLTENVKSFYFAGKEFNKDMIVKLAELYSDMWYVEWNNLLNFEATRPRACPVYTYFFTYYGDFCYVRKYYLGHKLENVPEVPGHGDDSSYFTYYKSVNTMFKIGVTTFKPSDKKVIDNFSALFTSFAKTGNPNTDKLSNEIDWQPYHPDNQRYLNFDKTLVIREGVPNAERVAFWNEMLELIKQNEDKIDDESKLEINEE